MNYLPKLCRSALCLCVLAASVTGQTRQPVFSAEHSESLQVLVEKAVNATLDEYREKGLTGADIAVTVVDIRASDRMMIAGYRADVPIYPASVVKMFYMVALHRWEADGKVKIAGEVERGLRDMITVSSNDATGYILDVLTGTSSGGELPDVAFKDWAFKRNAVNRYFTSLGYTNINVNQKTFCEDAYGIEQQFRNYKGENRNMLTTSSAARLMAEIATGKAVSPERSREMMKLMFRDWEKDAGGTEDREFISYALEPGTKLWSKEGWTSSTRHDTAYIETPEGRKIAFAIFTERFAAETGIIPGIARRVLNGLKDPGQR